ncbi:MAG: hypothetical protein LKCHEGNO_03230 [Burkholderiaceae bacterium]|nr:hypothetical protein [Burkholderiaceae bacterium]
MTQPSSAPDVRKVTRISAELLADRSSADLAGYLRDAKEYLLYYDWCKDILEEYVGLIVDGIVGIFLFRISPSRPGVDEWLWVIVGDLPPAYITCDRCPNPATALDGYIGAMSEWVDAASKGMSVAELIPVNVPATPANAQILRKRLDFLDQRVLADYREDLKAAD